MKKTITVLSLILLFSLTALGQQKEYKAYVVSNAHFDTQWNWTIQTSISQYLKNTMVQNIWLLDNYPEYVFNFEGGIKYAWMKEYYPEYYDKVKEYVLNGRWHITGSSWDATDANLPSTESFLRSIMLGQLYYKHEFGPQFMGKDIFLPDCFGFGYTLPTLASHAGLIGFSTQKLQWRINPFFPDGKKVPFPIGLWQGVDGSRIMVALDAKSYGKRWEGTEDISYDAEMIEMAQTSSIPGVTYRYYGTGDTGGSPSIGSVQAVQRGVHGNGPIKIISATSTQLFEEYLPFANHPELPVYDGELLQDVHGSGVYTSEAAMKRFNRRNEQLADAAERASVVADWFGGLSYQSKTFDEAWKRFIFHQFHDDITGTSTPAVYSFSWNDELISMTQFNDILTAANGAVSQALATNVKGTPVMVYNPEGYARKDIVEAKVPFAKKPAGISVTGPDGKSCPAQLVSYENGCATIIFCANVKPVSFSVFDVREASKNKGGSLKVSKNTIENGIYKIVLDGNGDISSIVDKRMGKELVQKGKAIRLAYFEKNESFRWPAWEIMKTTIDAEPVSITENVKISIEEQGPVRATIKVERKKDGSVFVQYISLTNGGYDDRITVKNEVDWKSSGKLLTADFPLSFSNPKLTYDLGLGVIERGNNIPSAYEVIGQQWADLTAGDGSYGVAVMTDCKYGWDKPADNEFRLTLLHTPATERNYAYHDHQDMGHHTFTYALVGHTGTYQKGGIIEKAQSLNQPLFAYCVPKHAGKLGKSYSFVTNVSEGLSLKALKKAEERDEYVVRVYENTGRGTNGQVTFAGEIESAWELNGIEERQGSASFKGNTLYVNATKFQPKTYGVKFKKAPVSIAPAENIYVPLKYTTQAYSLDDFRNAVRFDMRGNSYAAELIPDVIEVQGVKFKTGDKLANHAMISFGDTIALPKGHNAKKLYLLMASSDTNRIAKIKVDAKEYSVKVPYYSGQFGQWGLDGFSDGFVIDQKLGFIGSHRHTRISNEPHVFTYMYVICLDIDPNAQFVYLPKNYPVTLFAATLSNNKNDDAVPANEFRALPFQTKKIVYETAEQQVNPRMMRRR